ncbi:16649_t:CDS:2 [Entrophospora sp. SA101]|nr:15274_t:CDS:2 [Entrophospora sp. SA101]CAJ0645540.1 16649_t:CDS:2 [Entrophospora sp. SA101]CAJ0909107.1 4834_t:CDS:2 [Entrophospora sp. SA101]CAJ0912351.1 1327_t:CDS:2 [Entrophospora sp. SA101]
MGLTQLDNDTGLSALNTFLEDKSYIEGYEPSQADASVYEALKSKTPNSKTYPHAARWYKHVSSYSSSFNSLPAERQKAANLAEYQRKKANKPKPAAKSMVILDVKPWDDTTDMAELEKSVRSVSLDGLVWGTSKLVAVGYGIKKLQITCVVEDEKVSVDDMEEKITAFEDYVQSVDVAAFNKL